MARKADRDEAQRHAARLGEFGLQRGEDQRPRDEGERGEARRRQHDKASAAPNRRRRARCRTAAPPPASPPRCRNAGTAGRGPSASDSIMPIATSRSASFSPNRPMPIPATGEADEAAERRQAEQHRAGRAGEADMRQRVAGEGLAAQHEEEADRPGENRRDPGGGEGGAHEVVFKHARRRDRAHGRGRRPRAGARRARRRRRRP